MTVEIPDDTEAEEDAAGVALQSFAGAARLFERVRLEDWRAPALRRIAEAAIGLPDDLTLEERLARISRATAVAMAELERLVSECSTVSDPTGNVARRLREPAIRRELMSVASRAHSSAGVMTPDELQEIGWEVLRLSAELRDSVEGRRLRTAA